MPLQAAGQYLTGKIMPAISGGLGGLLFSWLWVAPALRKYSKEKQIAISVLISVIFSVELQGFIASYLGLDVDNIEVMVGLSFTIGLLAMLIVTTISNLAKKVEGKDIVTIVSDAKSDLTRSADAKSELEKRKMELEYELKIKQLELDSAKASEGQSNLNPPTS